ncbi:MAG: 50S ribosomal protein L15 [Verrucomicrobia bacterium]|nr:50S ribosomal protein L15 [Verrucomicrobiota bacterium]
MRLNNLSPRPGAKHRRKRKGCGESSGHGKTSGRGGKGQTARSGGSVRLGFEGGQMPMLRRIPKRGFNNKRFTADFATVNVSDLETLFESGATVTPESLAERGLAIRKFAGVKVLGDGELTKKLTVKAQAFSAGAKDKIAKAGGVCEELPLPVIHHKPKTTETK